MENRNIKRRNEALKEVVELQQNIDDFNRDVEIYEDYYIETNLSAKTIFTKVKSILSAYNLFDELYICFKEDEA